MITLSSKFRTGSLLFCRLLVVLSLFSLLSCQDSVKPITVDPNPNITASITGAISLSYGGPGIYTVNFTEGKKQIVLGTTKNINGTRYALGIYIFFLDSLDKTGTFYFKDNPSGATTDYAVATFEKGDGNNRQIFVAYNGRVNITSINQNNISGTFEFAARDNAGTAEVFAATGKISF